MTPKERKAAAKVLRRVARKLLSADMSPNRADEHGWGVIRGMEAAGEYCMHEARRILAPTKKRGRK